MDSPPLHTANPLRLGDGFVLDPNAYELRRSDRALKLERIPMELLLLLVEERGHLVSRDRIVERVWGKDVFLDTDNSINAAIRKIRQVLKDDPEQPRFVQTVTGRGYRFIAPVTNVRAAATDERVVAEPASNPPQRDHRSRSRLVLTLTALGLAAAGLVLARAQGRPRARRDSKPALDRRPAPRQPVRRRVTGLLRGRHDGCAHDRPGEDQRPARDLQDVRDALQGHEEGSPRDWPGAERGRHHRGIGRARGAARAHHRPADPRRIGSAPLGGDVRA